MSGSLDYVKNTLSGILDGSMSIVRHSSDTSDNWFSYMDIYYTTSGVYLVGKINANNSVWNMSGEEYVNDTVKDSNLLLSSNKPGEVSTSGNYYSKVNLKNILLDVNAEDGTNSFGAFVHEWTDISSGVTLHLTARTPANKAISLTYDSAPAPGTGLSDPVISLKGINGDIKVTLTLSGELITGTNPVNSIYFTLGSENVMAIGTSPNGEAGEANNISYMTFESDLSVNQINGSNSNTEITGNNTSWSYNATTDEWTVTYQLIQDLADMSEDVSNDVWYEVSVTYSSTLGNSNATKGHVHAQDYPHNVEGLSMSYVLDTPSSTSSDFTMTASWTEYSDEDYIDDNSAGLIRVYQIITGNSNILQYDFSGQLNENGTTDASWELVGSYPRDTTDASWAITNGVGDGKCVVVAAFFDSSDVELDDETVTEKLSRCINQTSFTGLNSEDSSRTSALTFAMLNNQPETHSQSTVVSNNISVFDTNTDVQTLSFVVELDSSHTNNNLDVSFEEMIITLEAEDGLTSEPSFTSSYTTISSGNYTKDVSGITDLSANVELLLQGQDIQFALRNNLKVTTTIVYKDPSAQDISASVTIPSSSSGFGGDMPGVRGPSNLTANYTTTISNTIGESTAATITRQIDEIPIPSTIPATSVSGETIYDLSLSSDLSSNDIYVEFAIPGSNNDVPTTYLDASAPHGSYISEISFNYIYVNGTDLTSNNIGMGGNYLKDCFMIMTTEVQNGADSDVCGNLFHDNCGNTFETDASGRVVVPMSNFQLWHDGGAQLRVVQTKLTLRQTGPEYSFTFSIALDENGVQSSTPVQSSATVVTYPDAIGLADISNIIPFKWNELAADASGNTGVIGDEDLINNMPYMIKIPDPSSSYVNSLTPSNVSYDKAIRMSVYKNSDLVNSIVDVLIGNASNDYGYTIGYNTVNGTDISDIVYGTGYIGLVLAQDVSLGETLAFEFEGVFINNSNVISSPATNYPTVHVQPFANPPNIEADVFGDNSGGFVTVAIDMTTGVNADNYPSNGTELVSVNNGVLDYITIGVYSEGSDVLIGQEQNHKIQSGLTTAISGESVDNDTQGQILITTTFGGLAAGNYNVKITPHIDIHSDDYTNLNLNSATSYVDNEINNFSKNDTLTENSVSMDASQNVDPMVNLQFEVDMTAATPTTSILVAHNQTQPVTNTSSFSHILFVSDKRMTPTITPASSYTENDKITINNSDMNFNQNLNGNENNEDFEQTFKLYKTYGGNTDPSDVQIQDISFVHLDLSVTLTYYSMENGHTLVKAVKSFGTDVSTNTSMSTSDVRMQLTYNNEIVESSDEFFVFPGDLSGQAVTVRAKHNYGDVSNTIILAGETSVQIAGGAVPTYNGSSVTNPTDLDYNLTIIDVTSGNIDVYNKDDGTNLSGDADDGANVGSDAYYFIENVYGCNTNIYSS
jgi:hypothetical protein